MIKKLGESELTTIIRNKNASYEFFIEETLEAGLVLQGWEVKSLRSRKVSINNSYITLRNGEAFLFGANFTPVITVSSNCICDPIRARKVLLNQRELNFLYGCINRKNYTVIVLSLFWKSSWCKMQIAIAKGKKQYNKRMILKEREWKVDKARIMKNMR